MMTLKRFLAGALLACLLPWSGLGEETAVPEEMDSADYLTPYAELYMLPVEPQALAQPQVIFEPATVEIDGVTVEFLQLVSDGSWILTCAAVASDEVLILPGAATLDRPAWGEIFVAEEADGRTFRELAENAGKEMRSVYVYLEEFDQAGQYFLDHSIEAERTILYSGCSLPEPISEPAIFYWTIQVYTVDLETGKLTHSATETIPVTVTPVT